MEWFPQDMIDNIENTSIGWKCIENETNNIFLLTYGILEYILDIVILWISSFLQGRKEFVQKLKLETTFDVHEGSVSITIVSSHYCTPNLNYIIIKKK